MLVGTIGLPIGLPSCSVCYTNNQVLGMGDMSETLRENKKNGNSQPWEVESWGESLECTRDLRGERHSGLKGRDLRLVLDFADSINCLCMICLKTDFPKYERDTCESTKSIQNIK